MKANKDVMRYARKQAVHEWLVDNIFAPWAAAIGLCAVIFTAVVLVV